MTIVQAAPLRRREDAAKERLSQERTWIEDAASRDLSLLEYAAWTTTRCSHRMVLHKGRQVVLWQAKGGRPATSHQVAVGDFEASSQNGAQAVLEVHGREVVVGHSPVMIAANLFVWLPFYTDLQRIPLREDGQQKITRFSLITRAVSNPLEAMVEGAFYLSQPSAFVAMAGTD